MAELKKKIKERKCYSVTAIPDTEQKNPRRSMLKENMNTVKQEHTYCITAFSWRMAEGGMQSPVFTSSRGAIYVMGLRRELV